MQERDRGRDGDRIKELLQDLPGLVGVKFTSGDLATVINGRQIHIPPPPGSDKSIGSAELLKGPELVKHIAGDRRFRGYATRLLVLTRILDDIAENRRDIEPTDEPQFVSPTKARYPEEVCPVLDKKLVDSYPVGDSFLVIYCPVSSGLVWIVPEVSDNTPPAPVKIQIAEIDRVAEGDTIYRRFGYMVGWMFGVELYRPVDNLSGRKVIRINHKRNNPPQEDNAYLFTDSEGDNDLPSTSDRMNRRDYPSVTDKFRQLMLKADFDIRSVITEKNISRLVAVTEAVRRLELKNGRADTRLRLAQLRKIMEPEIREYFEDPAYCPATGMQLENTVNNRGNPDLGQFIKDIELDTGMETARIMEAFSAMYKTEQLYLKAIYNYPWNSQGPEPFDALIEVLWFRYDFGRIATRYQSFRKTEKSLNLIMGQVFRKAWMDLRRDYVTSKISGWETLFANPEDVPIPTAELRRLGLWQHYLDRYEVDDIKRRKTDNRRRLAQPLGLTRLVWSTLKWAQPRPGRAVRLDDLDFDPEIADEHRPDTRCPADYQGRIVLAGEEHPGTKFLGHEETADLRGAETDLMVRLMRAAAGLGLKIDANEIVGLAPEQATSEYIPARSSVAGFKEATRRLSWRKIRDMTVRLDPDLQTVVYTRLGYAADGKKTITGKPISVEQVINHYFGGNAGLYYRCVKALGRWLGEENQSEEMFSGLTDEIRAAKSWPVTEITVIGAGGCDDGGGDEDEEEDYDEVPF